MTCTLCGEPADAECSMPKCKAVLCDLHARAFSKRVRGGDTIPSVVCPLHFAALTAVRESADAGRKR